MNPFSFILGILDGYNKLLQLARGLGGKPREGPEAQVIPPADPTTARWAGPSFGPEPLRPPWEGHVAQVIPPANPVTAQWAGPSLGPGTEEDRKMAAIRALIERTTPDLREAWGKMAYGDWWWEQQPEAVRRLRDIGDMEARRNEATRLAAQGYKIDPALAVYGWDPFNTMKLRASQGYTWVPAVGGEPIRVAPGLSFPGLPSYDPNRPPAASVLVDLNPERQALAERYLASRYNLADLLAMLASNYGIHL